MTLSANLGFPRIGARRELKKAAEAYWRGDTDANALQASAAKLRARHWQDQKTAGLDILPSNDFSLYDQVLDMTTVLGAVPERFEWDRHSRIGLDTYFAMARGGADATAMEMTKWFDTNYHYIVPEFRPDQTFTRGSNSIAEAYLEAKALGYETRPVLIGPVSYLLLGKMRGTNTDPLALLPKLLPSYQDILRDLKSAGALSVQIDEPFLVTDLSSPQKRAFQDAYRALSGAGPKMVLATYFGGLGDNLDLAFGLPVDTLHIDLARAPEQVERALQTLGPKQHLSLGLVDGRNIWRCDLSESVKMAERAARAIGAERLQIAPSCSLLHAPVDLDLEIRMDPELRSWLSFARQKLDEVVALATHTKSSNISNMSRFSASDRALKSRAQSKRIHNPSVKRRIAEIGEMDRKRFSEFASRVELQRARFDLPQFPTTTIGSFPQTKAVRKARAAHKRGDLDAVGYRDFLREATKTAIQKQEDLELDVLVHGEFERNDMVEYFGERLDGFAFTQNGWVQSYGSRCVKPPIIFGDVARPRPMTVEWSSYAQSLTKKPVKGMLTGPVTILQWSFVRDDQPRAQTCQQIALAIRDEVMDLEAANIGIIQIDEPALREGLPLRRDNWVSYLEWAVDCFRLSAAGVSDQTQIHTHMCYCEFGDIMTSIAALDADVISIETSRSQMELLEEFKQFDYPNEIGPGVWDIHSPRIPTSNEMTSLLNKAVQVIPSERLWVNPDCGLKTRAWSEVEQSLKRMVTAAKQMRQSAIVRP